MIALYFWAWISTIALTQAQFSQHAQSWSPNDQTSGDSSRNMHMGYDLVETLLML